MFQALRIWELGKLRRVLCLRRRPHECWVDYVKRTGVIVARQLKKHNQPRVQTLAMRRVRIAAWQMVSCPSDAKGRRYWEESVTWRCDEMWRDEYITVSKEDYRNSTQWKRPLPGRPTYWERPSTRFLGDAWIPKLKACNTWTEWLSLTKEFEYSWHVMLNMKPPESSSVGDSPVEHSKRPRNDSDPWNVAWPSDTHRRLQVLGDNKVVINWMNGAWEVKGEEHAVPVRGVVDQFVRWFLGGTFRPRTDESDWCRHIFRESSKAADTHANWLWTMVILDLERNGWSLISIHDKCKTHVIMCCLLMGPEGGADLVRLLGYCGYGMNTALLRKSPMVEALRMGIEYLTVLFPTEVSSFGFQVESTGRTVQYKLNAQSLRLFGLLGDVNDAHRAGANRNKTFRDDCAVSSASSGSDNLHVTVSGIISHLTPITSIKRWPNPYVSAGKLKACALNGLHPLPAGGEAGSSGRQSPDFGDTWRHGGRINPEWISSCK